MLEVFIRASGDSSLHARFFPKTGVAEVVDSTVVESAVSAESGAVSEGLVELPFLFPYGKQRQVAAIDRSGGLLQLFIEKRPWGRGVSWAGSK